MKEISAKSLFLYYQKHNDFRIIDIRDLKDYEEYHILDSINIPNSILINKPHLFIKKDFKYFIICDNGTRSKTTCGILENLGYNVTNVVDGIRRWPGMYVKSRSKFK